MLTIICNKFIQSVYDSLFDVGVGVIFKGFREACGPHHSLMQLFQNVIGTEFS